MLENNDPRYVRSRVGLRSALLEIAREDPKKLSVSAVCERTGVDRATFYRHFDDLDGLVEDALTELERQGFEEWTALADLPKDRMEQAQSSTIAYLRHIADHWALYQWALGPGGSTR